MVPRHYISEIPWLACAAGDKDKLLAYLCKPANFNRMIDLELLEDLLHYTTWLDMTASKLVKLLMDMCTNDLPVDYQQQLEEDLIVPPNPARQLLLNLEYVRKFMEFAHYHQAQITVLEQIVKVLESNQQFSGEEKKKQLLDAKVILACVYNELKESQKALKTNQDVIDVLHSKSDPTDLDIQNIARCYHGKGDACLFLGRIQEAIQSFEKSIALHNQLPNMSKREFNIIQSQSNLAQCAFKQKDYQGALQQYNEILKKQEKLYFGQLDINITHTLTHMGMVYRYLNEMDKAEEVYSRALNYKLQILGEHHFDVAIGYVNISNLHRDRKQFDEAIFYLDKALNILMIIEEDDYETANQTRENKIFCLIMLSKWEEAVQQYRPVFDWLTRHDAFDRSLVFIHDNILREMLRRQQPQDALKILCKIVRSSLSCDDHFRLICVIDMGTQPPPPPRPWEESLDRGIQMFPKSQVLLYLKISRDVIPTRSLTDVVEFVTHYYAASQDDKPDIAIEMASHCETGNWPEGAIALNEAWREKFPAAVAFNRNLAALYYQQKELDKSLECFQRASALEPAMWILLEKIAFLHLMLGHTSEAEQTIQNLQEEFGSEDGVPEKVSMLTTYLEEAKSNTTGQ